MLEEEVAALEAEKSHRVLRERIAAQLPFRARGASGVN